MRAASKFINGENKFKYAAPFFKNSHESNRPRKQLAGFNKFKKIIGSADSKRFIIPSSAKT